MSTDPHRLEDFVNKCQGSEASEQSHSQPFDGGVKYRVGTSLSLRGAKEKRRSDLPKDPE